MDDRQSDGGGMIQFEATGFKELNALLTTLTSKIENKVLASATRSAISKAKPDIVAAAPRSTGERSDASMNYGQLYSNIKVRAKRRKSRGSRGAVITTLPAFWGNFIELGTRYIAAKPWFLPAFKSAQEKMLNELRIKLAAGIEREAKKL